MFLITAVTRKWPLGLATSSVTLNRAKAVASEGSVVRLLPNQTALSECPRTEGTVAFPSRGTRNSMSRVRATLPEGQGSAAAPLQWRTRPGRRPLQCGARGSRAERRSEGVRSRSVPTSPRVHSAGKGLSVLKPAERTPQLCKTGIAAHCRGRSSHDREAANVSEPRVRGERGLLHIKAMK